MKTRILVTSILLTLGTASVFAQTAASTIQRDVNEQTRIEQGVRSGTVTNHEAANLERGQARVDRREAAAARDGHVGKREQAAIERKENHQSAGIYEKKHNARNSHPG